MGQVGSFAKVDTIASAEILCLDFFVGFHPDHNNRHRLKRTITDYLLTKIGLHVNMSIFHALFMSAEDLKK